MASLLFHKLLSGYHWFYRSLPLCSIFAYMLTHYGTAMATLLLVAMGFATTLLVTTLARAVGLA
jgi:hypothetical protein